IDACDAGSCLGNPGGARLGVWLAPRVSVDAFFLGIALVRESAGPVSVTMGGARVTAPSYEEHASVNAAVTGIGVGYRFFDRTPLTLRLSTGIGAINLATGASGRFGAIVA